ncbi:MAG: MopE-related protein, partial [Myxococcota bacterium]|nr:MopE-related protein [Myxococcota bacterium]
GVDDDCDGTADEGTGGDTDGDGLLDCADPDDDNDGALDPLDCAPLNAAIFPGAVETCNGLDDNCNGIVDDEGSVGCSTYHRDADGDGYGNPEVPPQCLCGPSPQTLFTTTLAGDCDDNNALMSPGVEEVCNFLDDNCSGEVDEGVASPCGGCQPVCVIDTGEGADEGFDEQGQESSGVAETDDGGLTLVSNSFSFPFIWVANSGEHTLSKVNTDTGCEAARYSICNNPSRTAVDLDGNGIVTCRGDGNAAKIAVLEPDCIDKNGNGSIDTSRDLNGDCTISGNEMVGNDECIIWKVKPDPGENTTRAAGVDKDNHVWVGTWNTKKLMRLNSETGAVMKTHNISARPYGLAIDGDGHMWVASRDPAGRLVRVHPEDGEIYATTHPSGQGYGIAVDPLGKVWMASGEPSTVARFDPDTNNWTNFGLSAPGYTRGVAVRRVDDNNGNLIGAEVFVAHHTWSGCNNNGHHRKVTVIDALSLQELPDIDIGADRAPVGVAVDSLGFLWTVNQCHSSATKINPDTGAVVGTFPVGSSPYTYSDMTGYALKTITTSQGFYTEVYNGWTGSQTLWHQILVDADLPGDGLTWLSLEYRLAPTEAGLASQPWQGPIGPFPPAQFPVTFDEVGNHLEIKVIMGTDDNQLKPTLHSVTVVAFELED